jgi:CheY-like chemotaxis protein
MTAIRVLLVDDEPTVTAVMAVLLSRSGCEVRCATSAAEALEIARTFLPASICLDLAMPKLDGFDLARLLRALPGLEKCRIVAYSGYQISREQQTSAGIDLHFLKPTDLDQLQRALCEPPGAPPERPAAD